MKQSQVHLLLRTALAAMWCLLASTIVAGRAQADGRGISVLYLAHRQERPTPSTANYALPADDGAPGVRLGMADNSAGVRFLKEADRVGFDLQESISAPGDDFLAAAKTALDGPAMFVIIDAPAAEMLALADLPQAKGRLLFNIGAPETRLRDADCRANVLHPLPSNAMLADALMQFLLKKRWTKLFLLSGKDPADLDYANAIRASARKFGSKIVAEKSWDGLSDNGRSASAEVPALTQAGDYDVVVVADTMAAWGERILYNTWLPRPVAGTHGLVPAVWDAYVEQWGETQLRNRFHTLSPRAMTSKDYAGWLAARSIGEAATKLKSADAAALTTYIRSDRLRLNGFKGRSLDYRPWSGEMRQPIFLSQGQGSVSVSPQEGFLHPVTDLDTLGIDRPETQCKF